MSKPLALSYSRVSGEHDQRTASLDSQEAAIVKLLESRGYEVPPEFRFQERFTGMESIYDRCVLMNARRIVAERAVSAFGCYDTDRMARDPDQLKVVVADNHRHGVETVFVKLDHETESRIGQMLLYLKGFASALEWDAIRDRTMRGRIAIRDQGQWLGCGVPGYGYVWNRDGRLRTSHPTEAPVVRRMYGMAAGGCSCLAIARALNSEGVPSGRGKLWHAHVVARLIRDGRYKGEVACGKTRDRRVRDDTGRKRRVVEPVPREDWVVLDNHGTEALVSKELWDRANEAISRRRRDRPENPDGRDDGRYLVASYLRCGKCGYALTPNPYLHKSGNQVHRYKCSHCLAAISQRWVDNTAWSWIATEFCRPGFIEAELDRIQAARPSTAIMQRDLDALRERHKSNAACVRNLVLDLSSANSQSVRAVLRDRLEELDRLAASIEASIANLETSLSASESTNGAELSMLARKIRDMVDASNPTAEFKRAVVVALGRGFAAWTENNARRMRFMVDREQYSRTQSASYHAECVSIC